MDLLEILELFEQKERKNHSKRSVRLSDLQPHQQFKITEEFSVLPWKNNYWVDYETPLDEKSYHKQLSKRRIKQKSHEESQNQKLHKRDKNLYNPY